MPSVYNCAGHSTGDLPWQNAVDLSLFTEMSYLTTGQEFVRFQARNAKAAQPAPAAVTLVLSLVDN